MMFPLLTACVQRIPVFFSNSLHDILIHVSVLCTATHFNSFWSILEVSLLLTIDNFPMTSNTILIPFVITDKYPLPETKNRHTITWLSSLWSCWGYRNKKKSVYIMHCFTVVTETWNANKHGGDWMAAYFSKAAFFATFRPFLLCFLAKRMFLRNLGSTYSKRTHSG